MTTLKYFLMICSICLLMITIVYPQMNLNEIVIQDDQAQLFLPIQRGPAFSVSENYSQQIVTK